MRTFVALEPAAQLREVAGELIGELSDMLPEMKWVKPANIHLTLRFLGEVDDFRLEAVERSVADAAAGVPPFELEVTELGHFGPPHRPRVIWLGLTESDDLTHLAAGLEQNLEDAGFDRADKPFRAHLTLARSRKDKSPSPNWDEVASVVPPAWPPWPVEEVCVVKSTLTPQGPIYDVLSRHPLAG